MIKSWGESASWILDENNKPHEAGFLKLDCSRMASCFSLCNIHNSSKSLLMASVLQYITFDKFLNCKEFCNLVLCSVSKFISKRLSPLQTNVLFTIYFFELYL